MAYTGQIQKLQFYLPANNSRSTLHFPKESKYILSYEADTPLQRNKAL